MRNNPAKRAGTARVFPLYISTKVCYNVLAVRYALVAQLDRVTDSDSVGRTFESCRAYQKSVKSYDFADFFYEIILEFVFTEQLNRMELSDCALPGVTDTKRREKLNAMSRKSWSVRRFWRSPIWPPCPMMGIASCGMRISAIHQEEAEERLRLIMLDQHIPAGAKIYE